MCSVVTGTERTAWNGQHVSRPRHSDHPAISTHEGPPADVCFIQQFSVSRFLAGCDIALALNGRSLHERRRNSFECVVHTIKVMAESRLTKEREHALFTLKA